MNMQRSERVAATTAAAPDICVILNPGSGRRKRQARRALRSAMDRHPGRFALRIVRRGRKLPDVAERVAAEGFRVLVAAGGDGTVGAMATVAHRHGLILGVIPMGTFNFFARGLGLPEDLDAAIDLLVAGPTRKVSPGEVNGALFLNNASLGLYPAILAQREGTYRRWGRSRLAAHWSVIVTFTRFHRPLSLRVTIDGREVRRRTPLAFVARSAYQLRTFGLAGEADADADRFALFLAPDTSRWGLFLFAVRLAWRSMKPGRDFDYFTGSRIDIETDSPRRLVARDGERAKMRSPFRFRVLRDGLTVIAPERA
ncbi:diacylglycerol kinase [Jannaschia sp. S6380]|uniref:diacylglycerol/lipid kinase family protein n=1 Tax=Jannaschia sp. S6380 TaxID=2926408 RepID=UPI001FF1688D|nr:diacylglycerol kinase family protein [Jannaschia sp. S6380]MCK0167956.1 diacylglycerol kinase [Jannaschia sp. S6380]